MWGCIRTLEKRPGVLSSFLSSKSIPETARACNSPLVFAVSIKKGKAMLNHKVLCHPEDHLRVWRNLTIAPVRVWRPVSNVAWPIITWTALITRSDIRMMNRIKADHPPPDPYLFVSDSGTIRYLETKQRARNWVIITQFHCRVNATPDSGVAGVTANKKTR